MRVCRRTGCFSPFLALTLSRRSRYVPPQLVFPASIVGVCRLLAPGSLLPSVSAKFAPPVAYSLRIINTERPQYTTSRCLTKHHPLTYALPLSLPLSPSLSQQAKKERLEGTNEAANNVRTTSRVSRVDSWCLLLAGTRVSVAVGFG